MRILTIEDDQEVQNYIIKGFTQMGHTVDSVNNGKDGLFMATTEKYDMLIVDRMLPELDGLTLIRTLRATDKKTPIIVLSALGDVEARVEGLKVGSDDYVTKPFAFSELSARVEALARRATTPSEQQQTVLEVADLRMDLLARKVSRQSKDIELQAREFRLLEYLMKHQGQVVTRTMLMENVWDYHFDPQTNVIDVHISRLRSKIDKDFETPLIKTIRGAGYIIE